MPRNILDDIVRDKRDELRRRQQATPLASLEARCRDLPPARDFEEALRPRATGVGLIAEVKKASPSRGTLAPTLDPVALATTYARHGADAISVLTDEKYFHGHLDLLDAIRGAVSVPLLRKDFTLAEYQLWESRAAGADAVLLIVSILEASELRDLLQAAKGVGAVAAGGARAGAGGAVERAGHAGGAGGEVGVPRQAAQAVGAVDAPSHSARAGGEMGVPSQPAQTLGAVDAPSHSARAGGEMGGASRPPHCS